MSEYSILVPDITAVVITPSTVDFNGVVTLSFTVVEKTVILEPEPRYSGEFYSGEM